MGEKKHSPVSVVFPFLFVIVLFCLIDLIIISSEILLWFFLLLICLWVCTCLCESSTRLCAHVHVEGRAQPQVASLFCTQGCAWSSLAGLAGQWFCQALLSAPDYSVCHFTGLWTQLLMCAWQGLPDCFHMHRFTRPFTAASCVAWLATFYYEVKF